MTQFVVLLGGSHRMVGQPTESWEIARDRCARTIVRGKLCRVAIKLPNGDYVGASFEQNDEILEKVIEFRKAQ